MNTITLADLTDDNASSGNSLLAVTRQLSISLGVAISAAIAAFYEGFDSASTVEQFHYTFITMGRLPWFPGADIYAIKPKDGCNLIKERHKALDGAANDQFRGELNALLRIPDRPFDESAHRWPVRPVHLSADG